MNAKAEEHLSSPQNVAPLRPERGSGGMFGKLPSFLAQLPPGLAPVVALVSLLAHNIPRRHNGFYYDAREYWELGRSFFAEGGFALEHFDAAHRGYAWPLFNAALIQLADLLGVPEEGLFVVLSAVGHALLFTMAWPWFVRALFGYQMNFVQKLGWLLLVLYFWRNYFQFPLTDFPALFLALAGVASIKRYLDTERALWLLGAGAALALAANARPSYQLCFIPLGLWGAARAVRTRSLRHASLATGAFTLGLAIAFAPQVYINVHKFDRASPFVQTARAYGGRSLFLQQLAWGIYIQRYETNVGKSWPVAAGGVVFVDPAGLQIVRSENIMHPKGATAPFLKSDFTLGHYARLVAERPLFFARLYARHLFNGLDIAYPSVYVTDVLRPRILFTTLNHLTWLTALGAAVLGLRRGFARRHAAALVLLFTVCVPSLTSVAGAVETRFFLPLFLLAYLVVVAGGLPFVKWLWSARLSVQLSIVAAMLSALLGARILSDSTFATMPFKAGSLIKAR